MITIAQIRAELARLKRILPPADDTGPYLWDELERRILEHHHSRQRSSTLLIGSFKAAIR
jgi:hypothetical protein